MGWDITCTTAGGSGRVNEAENGKLPSKRYARGNSTPNASMDLLCFVSRVIPIPGLDNVYINEDAGAPLLDTCPKCTPNGACT